MRFIAYGWQIANEHPAYMVSRWLPDLARDWTASLCPHPTPCEKLRRAERAKPSLTELRRGSAFRSPTVAGLTEACRHPVIVCQADLYAGHAVSAGGGRAMSGGSASKTDAE